MRDRLLMCLWRIGEELMDYLQVFCAETFELDIILGGSVLRNNP